MFCTETKHGGNVAKLIVLLRDLLLSTEEYTSSILGSTFPIGKDLGQLLLFSPGIFSF